MVLRTGSKGRLVKLAYIDFFKPWPNVTFSKSYSIATNLIPTDTYEIPTHTHEKVYASFLYSLFFLNVYFHRLYLSNCWLNAIVVFNESLMLKFNFRANNIII